MTQNKRTIAITGSIGSGKSTVARMLREMGEKVISCDEKTEESYKVARAALRLAFPFATSADGTVDRRALSKMVFSDDVALKKLNSILHPVIMKLIKDEIETLSGLIFIEVPLLFEANMQGEFDDVWLVYSSESINRDRIVRRDHTTSEAAKMRQDKQMPNSQKVARSSAVIYNEGDLADLERAVKAELFKLKNEVKGESQA